MYRILDKIDSPADLKGLSTEELRLLCEEIRSYMVECCSQNPGHLASSLGAVELIVGFHYVFDSPEDKLVFDVGHQAYAHKIITGRREAFKSMRTSGGISGFPRIEESGFDAFGAGHSSTSVSAALGLSEAFKLQGRKNKVIALIGDGALAGGLSFEGLNNAGSSNADLLVIVNDNNQSIDENIGGLHNHLLKITTSPAYNKVKDLVWRQMGQTKARNFFQRWIRSLKSWIVKRTGGDLFEALGFRYFGPIDGNDIEKVIRSLKDIKELKGPRILHCITVKGKGYAPAEADPTTWHAPGKFNPLTGERIQTVRPADRYQDVFGQVLIELAEQDEKIVGITPAMASGCGMSAFARRMPQRFFDVGIEEEHAVTFSAGLAAGGLRPVCNLYSTFAQRAFDQIIHDVALQRLPVVLCFDRAGVVGEDGATHQGSFDLAAFRSIPNTTIAAPSDEIELKMAMFTAVHQSTGPFIIRYPRGIGEGAEWKDAPYEELPVGKGRKIADGNMPLSILALGPFINMAVRAAERYCAQTGEKPGIYDMRFLKPLDNAILEEVAAVGGTVLTIEDGVLSGGLFGAVSEYFASTHPGIRVKGIGIPDTFIQQGRQIVQRESFSLSEEGIYEQIRILTQKD